ncbi:hypothetical protein BN14_00018 [Rhizoctonia solani AG-1 IB]|uniref:Uncharacterized protein n=1 Tax=Thanatephorus cucumeris (strain AG1-IB / isolate 7/3/14) TaxID=1108050 RepID=M5BI17_THACB|nr:hypothetical protein BN14_00018 [Rhizoctonia solani AG-1 IB]
MSAVINPAIPTLGRRIHVKKLSEDGEETDESYWLWLEFPETIKGLRSKCMEAFEPPRDHMIRFIHDDQLLLFPKMLRSHQCLFASLARSAQY